jgi:prophage antirepressor-like protein
MQETALTVFEFEGHALREVALEGTPYFVLGDACRMLDIANVTQVIERLNRADLCQTEVRNSRGEMRLTWVGNEYALYDLILRSEKPHAREVGDRIMPFLRVEPLKLFEDVKRQMCPCCIHV